MHVHRSRLFIVLFAFSIFPASISGSTVDGMEELDGSSTEDSGFMATHLNRVKRWLLTHSQHLNFFTVLVLASVSMHPPIYFTFCSSKWIMTVFTVSYNIFCFLGFNDQDLTITHCFDLIVGSKSFVWPRWNNVWTIWHSVLGILPGDLNRKGDHQNSYTGSEPRVS